jgi:hypothetical protein
MVLERDILCKSSPRVLSYTLRQQAQELLRSRLAAPKVVRTMVAGLGRISGEAWALAMAKMHQTVD